MAAGRNLILAFFLSLPLWAVPPASAAESPAQYRSDSEYYLGRLPAARDTEGFLDKEVRHYRSYPRLDRAYRLQRERRFPEAAEEFKTYLALVPGDLRVRLAYLALLDRMALYGEVVSQAQEILSRRPGFVPALLYQAQALRKKGDLAAAFAAYERVAGEKEVRNEDRRFALASALDLALSRQSYADAARVVRELNRIERSHPLSMQEGVLLERTGRPREALDAYGRALGLARPGAEKAAAGLAQAEAAKKLGQKELARQGYQTAIENDAANRQAMRGLADLALQAGSYDEAEKWLVLLTRNGGEPRDRESLAQLYLRRRDYPAAIRELQGALDQLGKKAPLRLQLALAQALEAAERLPEAKAQYRSLALLHPKNAELKFRYGDLLTRTGEFNAAGVQLKKALAGELPRALQEVAHRDLSLVYEKGGDYPEAARQLKLGLANQPPGGELLRLASLEQRAGRRKEALELLERALADPSLPEELKRSAHREKAFILEQSGASAAAAAELEKARSTGPTADPETDIQLALLLNRSGNPTGALAKLDLALAAPSLSDKLKRVALREKGLILERTGHPLEAAGEYEKAVVLGDRTPENYLALANLYQAADRPEQAVDYLNRVLVSLDATPAQLCAAGDGLGLYHLKAGRNTEAAAEFSSSLRHCGESRQRRYYLGLTRYRAKEWEQALAEFNRAEELQGDAATKLAIALCHKELGRPGAAVHYLLAALKDPGSATKTQLKEINDTLGYLYAEEQAHDKAARAFERSLALAPDNLVALKLASELQQSGETEKSRQALEKVAAAELPEVARIEYRDLQAALLAKSGRAKEAAALLEENQRVLRTAARSYTLATLYRESGNADLAVKGFQAAHELAPEENQYALSLGYAYLASGRYADAIAILERQAARDPESRRLREELGYLNARIGENGKAARWFEETLASSSLPPELPKQREQWEKDNQRIRSEIAKLTRSFSLAVYGSYRAGKATAPLLAGGTSIRGGLSGQLGFDAAYRPPKVGLVDDRILELFGRVFGDLDPNTLRYREASTQAGLGLRYKLLSSENLWLSGEKLIKIGGDAQSDWLLRLLYSRGTGFEPLPFEPNRDYYLVYAELDGYLPSDTAAAYAEIRKGRAFTLNPNWLLAPHLVVDARWQTPFAAQGNYLEGGAGIALKYFFGATRYLNYQSAVDFSVSYKHGAFFSKGFDRDRGDYDSVLVGVGYFY